ncbi:MAG: glycosyl transferase [Bacteroidales bacterium]|nr:glycosyl transferase [Bacteroidales bacterium]
MKSVKVGVLYIGIGRYVLLWDEFYRTSQKYLFPSSEKHYFVFTDDDELLNAKLPNVSCYRETDLGWPGNTLYRFRFFDKIKASLEGFDYLFFYNGNYSFRQIITEDEIFPGPDTDGFVSMTFDINNEEPVDTYPYERNPLSTAYIPYGEGRHYYRGSFWGGKGDRVLDMIETCKRNTEIDDEKGFVAYAHDESHLNKYLLNKSVKVVGREYGKPERWVKPHNPKAILREKKKALGRKYIYSLKDKKTKIRLLSKIISLFKR